MIELTTLVSYEHWFTAGELFAWVTANGYETNDIVQYCVRYVWPYWILCAIVFGTGGWYIWRCIKGEKRKQIWACSVVLCLLLLPLTVLPLRSNIVREAVYVYKQIENIEKHQQDAANLVYHASKSDTISAQELYVLSIGESLRYKNISLNGIYPRQTTPMLKRQTNLCLYSDYYANATLTQHALPLLFTPTETSDFYEHFNYKTIAATFSETGFTTALVSHRAQLLNNGYHNYLAKDFDTIIWVEHDSLIAPALTKLAKQEQKLFVVTHYLGNHMFYTNRTEDCLVWRPDYNADPKTKSNSLFLNAYDNSVLYTDRLLSECIDSLREMKALSAWLFISDHGEYISSRVSGHGHTYHPTKEEYHVPLMVWYSDEYAAAYPEKVANMIKHKDEPVCADCVFWSLLNMANIDVPASPDGKSIFDDQLKFEKREILLPDGKTIMKL
ncbi:MAG: phosphoethanolamine transferase [Paludibacteraceae bacterium]|nr:phosphoethanolamine transferase [Paludibacteraceae bacterium]